MNLLVLQIAVGAAGLLVWIYGAREDVNDARLVGIGLLAVAVLLRLLRKSPPGDAEE